MVLRLLLSRTIELSRTTQNSVQNYLLFKYTGRIKSSGKLFCRYFFPSILGKDHSTVIQGCIFLTVAKEKFVCFSTSFLITSESFPLLS